MIIARPHSARTLRISAGLAVAAVLCLGIAGCRPEPVPSASPTTTTSPTASPSASPTPTVTPQAEGDIQLPTACEQLYSAAMLASLQQRDVLNDPGVTMTSTQNVDALEILTSGIPTIRCTWAVPSETGLATNVSIVDEAQATAISDALTGAGFACESIEGGTICRSEQTMVTQDDDIVQLTETHVLRGNAWISTSTINFEVEGYTEDIIATLWG
ncbi:hypothetical protein SAMN04487846_1431 [Microbacterium sp. cf046]|uniref:hypothetical protein n=1 Tax=Microbacterium sp. cf046 TaxID=1761803 RepID=UPI0008EBC503|nr:hypothetical protein [Microbacterium sp. cf046]SFS01020.1 hypothetical protein SAMN04487846_1431 [Microbacterium sp. cf046]